MPPYDRVIRYLPINRTPTLPITVDGSSDGLSLVTRRNPTLGNVS